MKRKRIKSVNQNPTYTRVDLSNLKAFRPAKRSYFKAKARYELMLRKEITLMFKDLSYNSMLDEKRELRYSNLSTRVTQDTIMECTHSKVLPTKYVYCTDPVLGVIKKGVNFVERQFTKLEVVPAIKWA